MSIYTSLLADTKRPHCEDSNPCCEAPCDEPSFWDLLPQCRLNWIALGLAAFAIGFALIGLGYLSIGVIGTILTLPVLPIDSTTLNQGIRLLMMLLSIILISAWWLFKRCSDDWKTVVIGSLIGASGIPLAAIGLIYIAAAQFAAPHTPPLPSFPPFDPTWFNISTALMIASIIGFLLIAFLIHFNRCIACITAKNGVIVSLIFLAAGWATWSLGRLLWTAMNVFEYAQLNPTTFTFPATAYRAFIAVAVANIVLALALGWHVLSCSIDNCFTIFLPLFASAAPLANWALYRVGLNILSYVGFSGTGLPATAPLTQFAIAIGSLSITALVLAFIIANGCGDRFATAAASTLPLLYAIGAYSFVATARNLVPLVLNPPPTSDFVNSMLRGIFSGITLTVVLVFFLQWRAKCPIPCILYGLGAGIFGWAIIYLYSTYSANYLDFTSQITSLTTLNTGLAVIITAAVAAFLFITKFAGCDELVNALTLIKHALLAVGAAGFTGTIAYYQSTLAPSDIRAATTIYVMYVLAALFLPRFFAKCGGVKRQLVIAIASLAFGIAAIDLGRAIAYARAIAFASTNISNLTFSPLLYIAAAIGAVIAASAIIWSYAQANVYTAIIAAAIGLVADGVSLQVTFFVIRLNGFPFLPRLINSALVGVPWLLFTLAIVGLLLLLEFKSLCIPEYCRFLIGLLIPVFGIAVFGRVAGASAALGTAFNITSGTVSSLSAFTYNSRLMLVNSIIPLAGFVISLWSFKCTSCFAYLSSCTPFIAVVYVTSQFELPDLFRLLAPSVVYFSFWPLLNFITSVYIYIDLSPANQTIIPENATFITQAALLYILFLSPALIAAFLFSCSRPVTAAVLGSAIAATAVSFGAVGISNVFAGVLNGIGIASLSANPITAFISFTQFLQGIRSQLVLLAVGVITVLFILFDKCKYPC
jgi:hypothetical protein